MFTYKLPKTEKTANGQIIPRQNEAVIRSDGMWITFNEDSTHYQKYLKWLSEGNTPEPADE